MNVTNPRRSQSQLQVSMRQKTNVIIRIVVFSDKNKRLSFILSPLMQIFVFGSIEKEKYDFFFFLLLFENARAEHTSKPFAVSLSTAFLQPVAESVRILMSFVFLVSMMSEVGVRGFEPVACQRIDYTT